MSWIKKLFVKKDKRSKLIYKEVVALLGDEIQNKKFTLDIPEIENQKYEKLKKEFFEAQKKEYFLLFFKIHKKENIKLRGSKRVRSWDVATDIALNKLIEKCMKKGQ